MSGFDPHEKSQKDKLQKLYFRIGEVSSIVGVEPHVLRYWESEFRSVRPQKSARGQRIYSRRDVETLLKVKELLYSHRFTIAGAKQRLRDQSEMPAPTAAPTPNVAVDATSGRQGIVDSAPVVAAAPGPTVNFEALTDLRTRLVDLRGQLAGALRDLDALPTD